MKKLFGLCGAGLVVCLASGQSVFAQTKPARLALLVNATLCEDKKGIEPLGDAADRQADILLMTRALKAKGFDITTLQYDKATRSKILDALAHLASEAKPGDTVVFYFSGHGSYDKIQMSLCPWDAEAGTNRKDILENDLKAWLDKLKTRNVTLILDSCYSKVSSNGRASGPRYRTKSITRKLSNEAALDQQFHISPDQAVILSAANSNGVALQVEAVPSTWAGLFTWKIAKELNQATDKTTYRELLQNTCSDVQKWVELYKDDKLNGNKLMQTPTGYGADALMDRPLFSEVPNAPAPPQPANPPAANPVGTVESVTPDTVKVNTGPDSDLTPGSKIAVPDKDGNPLNLTVKKVTANGVDAVPDKGADVKAIAPNAPAVPTHAEVDITAGSKIVVRLDGSPEFQAKMGAALTQFKFLNVTTVPKAKALMIIKGAMTPDGIKGTMLEPDGISLVDTDNKVVMGKDAEDLAGKFSKELNQLAIASAMLKLQNPGRPFLVTVDSAKPQYQIGENAAFSCKADRDCFVFLYAVDSAGYPTLLYPAAAEEDNLLKKGDQLQLPPVNSKLTFPVAPPFGYVKVAVLAVLDPNVAAMLRKQMLIPPTDMSNHSGSRSLRAVENLQKLQLGTLDNWTVSSLSVTILQPAKTQKNAASRF